MDSFYLKLQYVGKKEMKWFPAQNGQGGEIITLISSTMPSSNNSSRSTVYSTNDVKGHIPLQKEPNRFKYADMKDIEQVSLKRNCLKPIPVKAPEVLINNNIDLRENDF